MGVSDVLDQSRPKNVPRVAENCPYLGLVKRREFNLDKYEEKVSSDHLLWNSNVEWKDFDAKRGEVVRDALEHRRQALENHNTVYELIQDCEETIKIPWRYVLAQHKDLPKIKDFGNKTSRV